MIDAFCDKLTSVIKSNVQGISDEKAEIINFGMKSIVSEITKLTVILLLSYYLGIFIYAIIAIISNGIYRTYAGGFHAKTHLVCLTTSLVIIYTNVYLSEYIAKNLLKSGLLYLIIYIFNCIMIYLYAPADVEEKPVLSKRLKKRLRIEAFIIMSLIISISYFGVSDQIIANILLLSTVFVSITLTPVSYRIMRCKHGCEGNIQ